MTVPITKKPITVAALRHGGTHLITPIIRRLTGKTVYSPKGEAALVCIASPIVVVFYRDPRNRVISNLRYKMGGGRDARPSPNDGVGGPGDRDDALFEFLSSRKRPGSLLPIEYMIQWAQRWQYDGGRNQISTRFETLTDREANLWEIGRIATLLEKAGLELVNTPADAHEYAIGTSGTYTGNHSKFREWFGPKSSAYWRREFGHELTKRMGYKVDEDLGI